MIIDIFKVAALASTITYLLRFRRERVALYIGDPASFAALIAGLRTDNPTLTGVMSWSEQIDPELALRICVDWLQRYLLGGADFCSIPKLLVGHLEPCADDPRRLRTSVHWVVANIHLGLGLAIRPYVHTRRDFAELVEWQNILNVEHGWILPIERPPGLRYFAQEDEASKTISELIQNGLDEFRMRGGIGTGDVFEKQLRKIIAAANKDGLWDQIVSKNRAVGQAAIIRQNETYSLSFESGFSLQVCSFGSRQSQFARKAVERGRKQNEIGRTPGDFERRKDRIATARREVFTRKHGPAWCDHFDLPAQLREHLSRPRKPDLVHDVSREPNGPTTDHVIEPIDIPAEPPAPDVTDLSI